MTVFPSPMEVDVARNLAPKSHEFDCGLIAPAWIDEGTGVNEATILGPTVCRLVRRHRQYLPHEDGVWEIGGPYTRFSAENRRIRKISHHKHPFSRYRENCEVMPVGGIMRPPSPVGSRVSRPDNL